MRFPGTDIAELYQHRWEIELGYREMKHSLQHRLTLRSKKAEGIEQALWGLLLAYNLLRSQMVRMAASLPGGYTASPLSFHMASVYLIHELSSLPLVSPGNVPGRIAQLEQQAGQFILPLRRERSYPRCVKARPQKYAVKKTNKNNASQA